MLGINLQAMYRAFDEIGYLFNRKTRADRGGTTIDLDDARLICGMMFHTQRKNEKRLLSCDRAITMAYANGEIKARYSSSSVLRVARQHGFHPDQLAAPTPHQNMASLHPNHVWQVDASIGTLFYLPKGGVQFFDEREHYKNKPDNLKKVRNDRCVRYVVTDHYSGAIYVKYYSASGETQEILFDVLVSAMEKKDRIIMHGVPFMLVDDKGAANTAHSVTAFAKKMHINIYAHGTGNSRAKGSVEKAQDIIECVFEGGLRLMAHQVQDVIELNDLANTWMVHFNSVEEHSRHKRPRYDLWQTITQEQLRIAPPREVMEALLTSKPVERTVLGDLSITFKGKGFDEPKRYSVEHIPLIKVNEKVLVSINPYRSPNIDVIMTDIHGVETYYECTPLAVNEAMFFENAAFFGEEMKAPMDTITDIERKNSLKDAYDGAQTLTEAKAKQKKGVQLFSGRIDPFKHVKDWTAENKNVAFIPKKGTAMDIGKPKQVFEFISVAEACKRIKAILGADRYPADTYAYLSKKYPNGIDPLEIDAITDRLVNQPKLKIIGE